MKERGIIQSIDGRRVFVVIDSAEHCVSCAAHTDCALQGKVLETEYNRDAKVGQSVELEFVSGARAGPCFFFSISAGGFVRGVCSGHIPVAA